MKTKSPALRRHKCFARTLGVWIANEKRLPPENKGAALPVADVVAAYLEFAERYYKRAEWQADARGRLRRIHRGRSRAAVDLDLARSHSLVPGERKCHRCPLARMDFNRRFQREPTSLPVTSNRRD